jgi:hypothetical protein
MATPYRCTVTIDGTKFNAISTSVKFSTEKDRAGMAQMGSLTTSIRVWADFHDDVNLPHAAVKKIFTLANVVTRDKIKDIKIEYWKDDSHQDALAAYSFKGWVSRFETSNPHDATGDDDVHPNAPAGVNHLLVLDLEPALNQQNFNEIKMTN